MKQAEKDISDTPKPVDEKAVEDREFTLPELEKAWSDYAEKLKQEERASELIILNQKYQLQDDYTILLELNNSIQESILDRFRNDFVVTLRETLGNRKIRLKTELVAEEVKERLYTAQDKFNYMAEKNRKILELRKRLGLDYDY